MSPTCAMNFLRSWCSGSIATIFLPCSYTHWALQQIDIWTITSVICQLQNLQCTGLDTDSNTCTRYADEIIKIQLAQMCTEHIQWKCFSQTILKVHSYDSKCYRQNACKKTGTKQCCLSVKQQYLKSTFVMLH
jgi:hypothetical protein